MFMTVVKGFFSGMFQEPNFDPGTSKCSLSLGEVPVAETRLLSTKTPFIMSLHYHVILSLSPPGACQHRQRDVLRAARSRRLRRLLQPPGRPRPLLHHRLQLLRGDACRDISRHPEGHFVSATGAPAAYCVALLMPSLFYSSNSLQKSR